MNSTFNCFHAGVNFVSACFGTSTRLPTSTDYALDEGMAAQVPVLARNQHEDTTATSDLIQDHSLHDSIHEAKHDTQPALSEVKAQSFPPNIVNVIPNPVCSPHQTNTTGVSEHTVPALSTPTSTPHTQDLMHHIQPVAHRTRSSLTKNRNMHNTSPGIRSTTNKHPKSVYKFQRRATQRWCKLLTATESRLAKNGIKDALGAHWPAFVKYAKDHHWPQWKALFSSTMTCNGPLNQKVGCPFQLCVEPTCPQDLALVQLLHLDHAYPLHSICRAWLSIIKSQPAPLTSWDQGVDGDLVCQLLFGVEHHPNLHTTGNVLWRANVRFRCYFNDGQGCHDVHGYANAHLTIRTTDIAR